VCGTTLHFFQTETITLLRDAAPLMTTYC